MDVNPIQNNQASQTSNDDELAKVLAGVNNNANTQQPKQSEISGLQFEETPAPKPNLTPEASNTEPVSQPTTAQPKEEQIPAATNSPVIPPASSNTNIPPTTSTTPELENIKRNALEELRPLVSKLDLPPEEKFDTLLLIIRSTDDQSLVQAAHEAAKNIPDETKRAQALLDVIKEIDYFSNPPQNPQQ